MYEEFGNNSFTVILRIHVSICEIKSVRDVRVTLKGMFTNFKNIHWSNPILTFIKNKYGLEALFSLILIFTFNILVVLPKSGDEFLN